MEPEEGGQDRENRERWYSFVGWERRGGLMVELQCVHLCVFVCSCVFWEKSKRKEQFRVYERMSEIGVWQRKSVAGVVIGGLVCCGKQFGIGEGGCMLPQKKDRNILLRCVYKRWWERVRENNLLQQGWIERFFTHSGYENGRFSITEWLHPCLRIFPSVKCIKHLCRAREMAESHQSHWRFGRWNIGSSHRSAKWAGRTWSLQLQ